MGLSPAFNHNNISHSALLKMKSLKEHPNKNQVQFNPQQIIEYCRQKFINILPNSLSRQNPREPSSSSDSLPINIMYRREEVKQLIRQLSVFLQLVIQNFVLSSDLKTRSQSLKLLSRFRDYLTRDLSEFENMLSNRIKGRLPQYEVDCRQFTKRDLVLRIPPQISLYQDPLLFYIYSRGAQEELFCNHSKMMTREQRIEILKNHIPFFNPLYIPLIQERLQTKAKFSELQDRLLQMIILSPRKDINKLRIIYFPNRPEQQIKNRIKNLCGNPKEAHNPIKDIKMTQYLPLRNNQIQVLQVAFSRYGSRWPVISKYYQIRTPEFLQAQYNQCEKLKKKRMKQQIIVPYDSLKQLLQDRVNRRIRIEQPIQAEGERIEEGESQVMSSEQMQDEGSQPVYKIINNVTFLVEQL